MSAKFAKTEWRRQSQIERLADEDPLFRDNFSALVRTGAQDPVKANVQAWLVRSHYARARRNQPRVVHPNWKRVERLEKELMVA